MESTTKSLDVSRVSVWRAVSVSAASSAVLWWATGALALVASELLSPPVMIDWSTFTDAAVNALLLVPIGLAVGVLLTPLLRPALGPSPTQAGRQTPAPYIIVSCGLLAVGLAAFLYSVNIPSGPGYF